MAIDRVSRGLALSKVTVHARTLGAMGDGINPDDDGFDNIVQFFRDNPGGIVPSSDASNTGATQELMMIGCNIDSAVITGDLVSGALNDVYLSTGNRISNSTVTVNEGIVHYKSDDLVF